MVMSCTALQDSTSSFAGRNLRRHQYNNTKMFQTFVNVGAIISELPWPARLYTRKEGRDLTHTTGIQVPHICRVNIIVSVSK